MCCVASLVAIGDGSALLDRVFNSKHDCLLSTSDRDDDNHILINNNIILVLVLLVDVADHEAV